MKKSIAFAAFLATAAGATGVAALPSPYQGSDTLFNVTTQAIAAAHLTPTGAYVGGGSGNGASAMANAALANATQQTAPMSRMMKAEGKVCNGFNGGDDAGSTATNASGVVIGLDAVDLLSSTQAGGSATCNAASGGGLASSGTTGVFTGTGTQNWKWVLALVYGGLDLSNPSAPATCDSAARATLVANWSSLFQNGCSNSAAACGNLPKDTGTTAGNNPLWHAYRRDDTSGTSDVFASILGLSPSTSNSAVNGFGTSPYCNALNYDTSAGNAGCALGAHDQYTGPGGVKDPASTSGTHRMPPPGVWGTAPVGKLLTVNAWDVLPTQFQDNDPIRRKCQGQGGFTNLPTLPGEEVCNLDGALGLVLPMADSDFIVKENLGTQFPTNACTTFVTGKPLNVYACANPASGNPPANRPGECPNGDSLFAGSCLVPIDGKNGTSQCVAKKTTTTALTVRTLTNPDGRIYNLHLRDGSVTDGSVGYIMYTIPSISKSWEFSAAFNRIHQVETMVGTSASACQLQDMTDQIGCLTQADPCSIGYAGDGSKLWYTHTGACAPNQAIDAGCPTAAGTDALRVAGIYPQTSTVQLLGQPGEYQLSRKLYFNSLVGFANVAATTVDTTAADEITLAQFEANPANINPILTANGFFTMGPNGPSGDAGIDTPFCEDFNEVTICHHAAPNNNGCATNGSVGLPTVSTTCGNGVVEAFEECDGTLNAGTGGCSPTCRCKLDFNEATGQCN